MIIDKPFKTYYQQLRILRSRNLLIPNGSRAVKILKRENYYNIINGYKDIFLDSNYSTDFYNPVLHLMTSMHCIALTETFALFF